MNTEQMNLVFETMSKMYQCLDMFLEDELDEGHTEREKKVIDTLHFLAKKLAYYTVIKKHKEVIPK